MKRFILIVCLLFQVIVVCGQTIIYPDRSDSSILRIRDFYKGYGKVFYNFGQAVENIKGAEREMIISVNDVIEAEKILFDNYNEAYKKDSRTNNFNFQVKNPKKHLRTYYRQYFGFYNVSNDRVIVINLVNFKKRKKAKDYFRAWKSNFSMGNGHFYEKNQELFLINLTKQSLSFH